MKTYKIHTKKAHLCFIPFFSFIRRISHVSWHDNSDDANRMLIAKFHKTNCLDKCKVQITADRLQ